MFSLHDIDMQVWVLETAADELEEIAAKLHDAAPVRSVALRCEANGLRTAANSLGRMVTNAVEEEALEALRRGVA